MDWRDVAGKVAQFAPTLGSLLGAPGLAVGTGISLIARAFGITEAETTPERVDELLRTDPQAAIKFKEIESKEKIEMQKILLQETEAYLQDVNSARNMKIKETEATGQRDSNIYVIAYMFLAGFFVLTGGMAYMFLSMDGTVDKIPQAAIMLFGMLIGTLTSGVTSIIQYFYGSSKSSSDKNKSMFNLKDMLKK